MINGLKFGLPAQGKEYHKTRLNGINVGSLHEQHSYRSAKFRFQGR